MLKLLDKILTVCIDWLYLKRTKVRLALTAKESENAQPYSAPYPEAVDNSLGQFGLAREELAVRMGGGKNTDAALTH